METRDRHTKRRVRVPAVPAWLRLVRVFHKVDHVLMAQLRAHDLSLAQFDVLAQLGANEGLTQQELADHLLVTKGNVVQLLDRMGEQGLLVRQHDGRCNRLYLTETGRKLYEAAIPAHEGAIAQLFATLTPEEQRQLASLLRRLDRALE